MTDPLPDTDARLIAALHEAATYGIGATCDFNQKIIVAVAQELAVLILAVRNEDLEAVNKFLNKHNTNMYVE